jgi:membrane associated rhomboid family serine protease
MQLPQSWSSARATLVIAGVTAALWLIVAGLGLDEQAAIWGGFIPARVGGEIGGAVFAPVVLTPLTATLVHAGIVHLAFNLIVLLACGRAIEPILGKGGLIILYVLGAYAAAAAEYAVGPRALVPMIGASGAISAVIGAYAMLFGRNKVKVANPIVALWLHVLWLAAAWVGLQLMVGFAFVASGAGAIAVAAHIGGFIIGLALARPLLLLKWRGA